MDYILGRYIYTRRRFFSCCVLCLYTGRLYLPYVYSHRSFCVMLPIPQSSIYLYNSHMSKPVSHSIFFPFSFFARSTLSKKLKFLPNVASSTTEVTPAETSRSVSLYVEGTFDKFKLEGASFLVCRRYWVGDLLVRDRDKEIVCI